MDDASPEMLSLFAEALDRPGAGDRAAFLDRACGPDADLRRRIEALLRAHDEAGGFLADAGPVETADLSPGEGPAAVIGPYKLVERIGEGGMGSVWLARQTEPVQRTVAVKLIKAGMDSRQVIARFEAERQALALMDHPNIARVLDAATTADGRPYFVMELVKGVPITTYCDEHRLTPRERLELFVPVCLAVQHAHQKGVIHRDLKPSNILVARYDDRPVPKVIDFGVAKATGAQLTEATLHTAFGAVVGTVEYMSPEQATFNQLDVDTRSDLYSLGVLLYELLTGTTPLDRKHLKETPLLELLRIVREDDTVPPSSRLSTVSELPAVAAKRGVEPKKLSGLVRGELDWIVMKALEKDRNRRYETAASLATDVRHYLNDEPVLACPPSAGYRLRKFARRNKGALAVAAGLGLLVSGAGAFAWHADRQSAVRGRDEQARLDRTAEAVAALLDQCELFLRANRADRAAVALGAAVRRAGDGGADALADRLARCQAELSLLRALDDTDTDRWTWAGEPFPDLKAAAARWQAALADYGVTADEGRAAEAAAKVNESLVRDRVLTALDGWLAAAPSAGVRAVLRAADPDPYRDAVRDAVADRADRALATLAGRPEALDQPGRFAVVLGQLAGIPKDRGRAVLESALGVRTGDLGLLMALALTYPMDTPEGAGEQVRWFQAALAAQPGNVAALNNLGLALRARGDVDAAIRAYREAIRFDPKYARPHLNLGFALKRKGDLDGAIREYREAIRLDPTEARAHNNLGSTLLDKGDADGAIVSLNEAIRLNPNYAHAHFNLGLARLAKGDRDGAVRAYHESIRADPTDPDTHYNLGNVLRDKGDLDAAITSYTEAIRLNPKYSQAYFNLGLARRGKRDLNGAVAAFRGAIGADPNFADSHANLGSILMDKGDWDGAIAAFQEAIRLNPRHAIAHFNHGAILHDVKRDYDGAITAFQEAIRHDPTDADSHHCLGHALRNKGSLAEAVAAYRDAARVNSKHPAAHNQLGRLLATGPAGIRNGKQAVEYATRACELTKWRNPDYIDTLAAAHAEAGDFDRAVEFQKKTLTFPNFTMELGPEARERLARYERKEPYRNPAWARGEAGPPPRVVKP